MPIQYQRYTIGDLRDWLYNDVSNGLSAQIISKTRANAYLHNPFVTNDMVVVVVARDGEKVIGYTHAFPDQLVRPDITLSCATTLYADPDYAGEFIGYYVSEHLHLTANGRLVIGSDIADATVIIDKLLGLQPIRGERKRFIIRRHILPVTPKLWFSRLAEPMRRYRQKQNIGKLYRSLSDDVSIEYTDFIDNEAYSFIAQHSVNDVFLRSQKMLNWILRYPFRVEAPCFTHTKEKNLFASETKSFSRHTAKVWKKNQIIGLFTIALHNDDAHILLLYLEDTEKEQVYSLLLREVLTAETQQLWSMYKDFNEWMQRTGIALKTYTKPFVFTHPKQLIITKQMQFQGADGDMFA